MPTRCPAFVPALGLLAFALGVLPSTTAAQAEQCVTRGTPPLCDPSCEAGEYVKARIDGGGCLAGAHPYQQVCCKIGDKNKGYTTSGSVNPCDDMVGPGYEYVQPSGQPGKCVKKTKKMGKSKKAACERQGKIFDPATGNCNRPFKDMGKGRAKTVAKYDCEAQGRQYDPETGSCNRPIKRMGKGKARADCEDRGPRFRYDPDTGRCIKRVSMSGEQNPSNDGAFDDEDFQPKKKKRRKHKIDLDIDIF